MVKQREVLVVQSKTLNNSQMRAIARIGLVGLCGYFGLLCAMYRSSYTDTLDTLDHDAIVWSYDNAMGISPAASVSSVQTLKSLAEVLRETQEFLDTPQFKASEITDHPIQVNSRATVDMTNSVLSKFVESLRRSSRDGKYRTLDGVIVTPENEQKYVEGILKLRAMADNVIWNYKVFHYCILRPDHPMDGKMLERFIPQQVLIKDFTQLQATFEADVELIYGLHSIAKYYKLPVAFCEQEREGGPQKAVFKVASKSRYSPFDLLGFIPHAEKSDPRVILFDKRALQVVLLDGKYQACLLNRTCTVPQKTIVLPLEQSDCAIAAFENDIDPTPCIRLVEEF